MKRAKLAGVFAAAGFVLSFVSGLFSGGGLWHILGMAVVFAVAFGALGTLIEWLTNGVLNVNGASDGVAIDEQSPAENTPKTGSTIDVVVKDEELPSEENSPRFFVGNNHQMLDASDYGTSGTHAYAHDTASVPQSATPASSVSESAPTAAAAVPAAGSTAPVPDSAAAPSASPAAMESAPSSGEGSASYSDKEAAPSAGESINSAPSVAFEPVALGTEKLQTANSGSAAASAAPSQTSAASSPAKSEDELDDELDEIPEFQGVAALDDSPSRNIDGDMIEDSDFSQAGAPIKKKGMGAESQDAALMAKAISTVLAKDK